MSTNRTSIEVLQSDDTHTHVAIIGPLDLSGVQSVELKFTAHTASRRKHAIVDLSQVEMIASLGMSMLIQVNRALAASKCRLVILSPSPMVDTALRTARLDTVMAIKRDLAEAYAHAHAAE